MKKQALTYVREELETVERLLSQSQGDTVEIQNIILMLTNQLAALDS